MTDKLLEIIQSNKYNFLGLRFDNTDYAIGDDVACSADLSDGHENEYLDGTSAYAVNCNVDAKEDVEKIIKDFTERYSVCGKNILVITGTGYDYGDDNNEYVIHDATVIYTERA